MPISEYNSEQLHAFKNIRAYIRDADSKKINDIKEKIYPYLDFRSVVDNFQRVHLFDICTAKCFTDMKSACCNREGIATFFADVVVNVFYSDPDELDKIEERLIKAEYGHKCVYLTGNGCVWRYKPVVCEMFLCDHAKTRLSEKDDASITNWHQLRKDEKQFTWPDKPVLFDELECLFIKEGLKSPLMYFHRSPGLLRIKSGWENDKAPCRNCLFPDGH